MEQASTIILTKMMTISLLDSNDYDFIKEMLSKYETYYDCFLNVVLFTFLTRAYNFILTNYFS